MTPQRISTEDAANLANNIATEGTLKQLAADLVDARLEIARLQRELFSANTEIARLERRGMPSMAYSDS